MENNMRHFELLSEDGEVIKKLSGTDPQQIASKEYVRK